MSSCVCSFWMPKDVSYALLTRSQYAWWWATWKLMLSHLLSCLTSCSIGIWSCCQLPLSHCFGLTTGNSGLAQASSYVHTHCYQYNVLHRNTRRSAKARLMSHAHVHCRLPYAVVKSSNTLSKLQSRLCEQRAESLANPAKAQPALQGFLDNMIVPTSVDAYIKPLGKLTGQDVINFRNKYRPLADRKRSTDAVSYDSRNDGDANSKHFRRLLLSAECQIGKTGAYLALLQDLRNILQPQVLVALPNFDATVQPTEDEPDVPGDGEQSDVIVDWDRQVSTCKCCALGVVCAHRLAVTQVICSILSSECMQRQCVRCKLTYCSVGLCCMSCYCVMPFHCQGRL